MLGLYAVQPQESFADPGPELAQALYHSLTARICPAGTLLFTPEEPREQVFLLLQGQVDLYRLNPEGKRLIVRRVLPGGLFGEIGLLGKSMRGCFAEAVEDCRVCTASREEFLGLITEQPRLALRLLESMGNRLKTLEERLEQTAYLSVRERLAIFLLENLVPAMDVVSGYSHAQIGDTIGASRPTVTLALRQMANADLLEVRFRSIRLVNRPALERIAYDGELEGKHSRRFSGRGNYRGHT